MFWQVVVAVLWTQDKTSNEA